MHALGYESFVKPVYTTLLKMFSFAR